MNQRSCLGRRRMYEQPYNTEPVLQPVSDIALRGNERATILSTDGQPILQQPLYSAQNEITVISDSGMLLPNAPQNAQLLQAATAVPIGQSHSSTFVQQPFLGDSVTEHPISPLINDRLLQNQTGTYDTSKRIRLVGRLRSSADIVGGRRGREAHRKEGADQTGDQPVLRVHIPLATSLRCPCDSPTDVDAADPRGHSERPEALLPLPGGDSAVLRLQLLRQAGHGEGARRRDHHLPEGERRDAAHRERKHSRARRA